MEIQKKLSEIFFPDTNFFYPKFFGPNTFLDHNLSWTIKFFGPKILAQVCGVPVGRRSGGQMPTTLVATKNNIIFFS